MEACWKVKAWGLLDCWRINQRSVLVRVVGYFLRSTWCWTRPLPATSQIHQNFQNFVVTHIDNSDKNVVIFVTSALFLLRCFYYINSSYLKKNKKITCLRACLCYWLNHKLKHSLYSTYITRLTIDIKATWFNRKQKMRCCKQKHTSE